MDSPGHVGAIAGPEDQRRRVHLHDLAAEHDPGGKAPTGDGRVADRVPGRVGDPGSAIVADAQRRTGRAGDADRTERPTR